MKQKVYACIYLWNAVIIFITQAVVQWRNVKNMKKGNEDVKTIKKSGLIYITMFLVYFIQNASNSFVSQNSIGQTFFLTRLLLIVLIAYIAFPTIIVIRNEEIYQDVSQRLQHYRLFHCRGNSVQPQIYTIEV